jgi:hypothetical protein
MDDCVDALEPPRLRVVTDRQIEFERLDSEWIQPAGVT